MHIFRILCFDFQDTITEETVELLAAYLDMDDYNLETAKKVCGDVAGLASWSMAMSFFYGYALFEFNTKWNIDQCISDV